MTNMGDTKACIACAEEIKLQAQLCKHCNTRQDEKSFQKTAKSSAAPKRSSSEVTTKPNPSASKKPPVSPKKKTTTGAGGKAKNDTSLGENQMLFAGGAVLLVIILALSLFSSGFSGFTSNTNSSSPTVQSEKSSQLRGEAGVYYCEPNLCDLYITNTGSSPVYVSGDLCGVVDGNVYVSDNSVSIDLNPQQTYAVDFSFGGWYDGDSLDKVWLGDCSDESSAELVWNSPSRLFSPESQGEQGQTSQSNASSSTASSSGTNLEDNGSASSNETSAPTSSPTPAQPSPEPTQSDEEKLLDWVSSIEATIVSEKYNHTASWYEATISFSFAPYPLSRMKSFGVHTFDFEGGQEVSKWEAAFGASLGMTNAKAVIVVDEEIFKSLSQVAFAIHNGANMPGSPIAYVTASR